jgi:hypothetical protein
MCERHQEFRVVLNMVPAVRRLQELPGLGCDAWSQGLELVSIDPKILREMDSYTVHVYRAKLLYKCILEATTIIADVSRSYGYGFDIGCGFRRYPN